MQHLDSDGFECSHFLRTIIGVLDSELKGSLTIENNGVAFRERWIHLINGREVEGVQDRLLAHITSKLAILVVVHS